MNIVVGFRATSFTEFVENTCNICVSKYFFIKTKVVLRKAKTTLLLGPRLQYVVALST
jgi:hypothetical protein